MKITVTSEHIRGVAADILAVGLFEGTKRLHGVTKTVDEIIGGAIARAVKRGELKGKFGESMVFLSEGRLASDRIVVVGLGSKEKFSLDKVRHLSL